MQYLNAIVNAVGDVALAGLRWQNPWPAMFAAALLATVALLLVMRTAANPAAIERSKKKLIARVMELHLFRHDPVVTVTACGRIVAANLVYLRHLLFPTCVAMLPGLLILIQLNCWFSGRPLRVGEAAIVEVQLAEGTSVDSRQLAISTSESLIVDSPPLRIPALRQINWRIRARQLEPGWIDVTADGRTVRKSVTIGDRLLKLSQRRVRASFWETLLNPVEPPIEAASPVEAVEVRYPRRQMLVGLTEVHWLAAFLGLTILFGAILKGPLKAPL